VIVFDAMFETSHRISGPVQGRAYSGGTLHRVTSKGCRCIV
jgi:hypothetical protein